MQAQELVLRDVHVPAAPSLWPPAPGWWLVAAAVLAIIAIIWLLNFWASPGSACAALSFSYSQRTDSDGVPAGAKKPYQFSAS